MPTNKKKTVVAPPSLQPRKTTKKSIPGAKNPKTKAKKPVPVVQEKSQVIPPKTEKVPSATPPKEKKERFTLWLSEETYRAFKIHTATRKGSSSDYIEELIKRDLKIG